jgi:large subunit ribosomal protein L35
MPKIKSNSGAKKRFSLTGTKKVKRASSFKGHLLEKKSSKRKRSLRGSTICSKMDERRVKRMLPYA